MTLDVRPKAPAESQFQRVVAVNGRFWPPAAQAAHDLLLHKTPGRTILVSQRPGIRGMPVHCSLEHHWPS